jgi:putative PIN family toxin of toxin-antitoxin system
VKAVVDASVLVSAFLFPDSLPGAVLRAADQARFALHLSPLLREETRRSLLHPRLRERYGHDADDIDAWLAELVEIAFMLLAPLPPVRDVCRDPDDAHVLAAAVAVGAEYIVTGDKDLLALGGYDAIRIVSARAFLNEIGHAG